MSEPAETSPAPEKKKRDKYRRDKPWDNDNIDHWKVEEWKPDYMSGSMTEESSFATLFPKYREQYLREVWPAVTKTLEKFKVKCELNLVEGSMTVRTTRKTWDPYCIMKARDLIKLLARSIPVEQALKIMLDDVQCDIIKIGNLVRNKERFVKRRQRLVGPNGATLKALELLTKCYILVQGNTVSAMGGYKGLKQVRQVVEDCMHNIHPIYNIKTLMIKRELEKDPNLTSENWERFLPNFQKKAAQSRKPHKIRDTSKKAFTPFPPAQQPRKVDGQLDSGEYFLNEAQRKAKKDEEKRMKRQEMVSKKKRERQADFIAPAEPKKKKNRFDQAQYDAGADDLEALKEKLKKSSSKSMKSGVVSHGAQSFVAGGLVEGEEKKKVQAAAAKMGAGKKK